MKHSLIWVFAVCKCSLLGIICENIHSLHLKRKKMSCVRRIMRGSGIFVRRECVCVEGGCSRSICYKKALATFFFFQFNYFSPQLILSDYRSPMINFKEKILSFSKVSERYKHFQGIQFFRGRSNYRNPYSL